MFVRKKEFNELKHRVECLEDGNNTISTVEYGEKSLKFYIRLLCNKRKKDPIKLRSFEN